MRKRSEGIDRVTGWGKQGQRRLWRSQVLIWGGGSKERKQGPGPLGEGRPRSRGRPGWPSPWLQEETR